MPARGLNFYIGLAPGQNCTKWWSETARSHNDEAIVKSVEYYYSKVKLITFDEGELVFC